MTTHEEYAEAAEQMDAIVTICKVYGLKEQSCLLAARVLRALADGAVLCDGNQSVEIAGVLFRPELEPQP